MFYTYLYFHQDGTPYYVGSSGWRQRCRDRHRVPVPPHARILVQHWASKEEMLEMERWLIQFYGRLDIGTGLLLNESDGPGCLNPNETARAIMRGAGRKGGLLAGSIGGRIAARKNVESGQLSRARAVANHHRWHLNREIVKPNCSYCVKGIATNA